MIATVAPAPQHDDKSPAVAGITVRADLAREVCDRYVADHPDATTYHQTRWLEVIQDAFGRRTILLAAERQGRVVGLLPLVFFTSRILGRFAVSVPFVNYGGMLADDAACEQALLERAIEEVRAVGGSHLELRHTRQHFEGNGVTPKRHKVSMLLHLGDTTEAQWQGLDKKLRNQVRKAEKSGLEGSEGGPELLPQFYEVFARNMRDLGTPVYDIGFFRKVLTTFPDHARVFVVTLAGRPVAASLVHWHRRTIEVPWASSIRDFNPLCPNVLLYWQMLRFAIDQRFATFDFGRSTPGEGTYLFKKQWGAEPQELVWEYWTADGAEVPDLNPKNPKFDLAIRTWQRLPVALTRALGPSIVRNIP